MQEALGVSPDKVRFVVVYVCIYACMYLCMYAHFYLKVREAIVNKFKMTASAAPPIVMPFRGGLFGFEPAQQYQKKKDSNRLGLSQVLKKFNWLWTYIFV